ncbi:hypothetical protein ABFA07_021507 [Porites harrisoni]
MFSSSVTAVIVISVITVAFSAEIPNLKPGDGAPPFMIQARKADQYDTLEILKYGTNDSNIQGPIVFLAHTKRSGFLESLLSDPECFNKLIDISPDNVNYVFLFYADSAPTACNYEVKAMADEFANRFYDAIISYTKRKSCRLEKLRWPSNGVRSQFDEYEFNERSPLPSEFQQNWLSRVHFAVFPVSTLGNWIPRVLSQWYCSGHNCGLDQIVVEDEQGEMVCVARRLDARYDWLPSPDTLAKYGHLLVVYVGDACSPDTFVDRAAGHLALVSNETGNCSYFIKVQNCQKNGALGVLVFARQNQPLEDMNCQGSECNTQLNIPATMITFDTGFKIKGSSRWYIRFQNTPSDVFAFGIDGQGKVQETGWFLYPSMRFLAYQAQWFNYKTNLLKNLTTRDAVVINVFNHTVMQGEKGVIATVEIPSIDDLQRYEHVELDFSLSCPGSTDDPCAHWDHTVQLYVCCNSASKLCGLELGRWITPFRRRIGRWLTPVKPLIPLLQTTDPSSKNKCVFTLKTAPWAMAWVPSLNIRLVGKVQVLRHYTTYHSMEKSLAPFQIVPLFRGGTFDKHYNSKYSPFPFVPPSETERVKLVAVITGHGSDNNNCAEFCVTSHHFIVNKEHNYTRVFSNAGTAMGCADRVPEGVVPNEHGTWLYGRDGWCDGQEVIPWVVDITSALKPSNNTIRYFGWFNNTDPNPTRDPGEIIMYSYLVYYKYLDAEISSADLH